MGQSNAHNGQPQPAEALAVEAVRALLKDREALDELWKEEESVLTIDDVLERVPWSRPTVMKMVKKREIPMVKKRGKWIMTRKAYRRALERGFEAPKNTRTYSP